MAKSWCMAVGAAWSMGMLGGCQQAVARESQCQRICEKRELCDSTTDEKTCLNGCLSQTFYSESYMKKWATCVAPNSVSCDVAMDDDVVEDCVTGALRAEEPSELLEDVCRALSTKLAACEGADAREMRRSCERGDSLKFSEAYLESSRDCVDGLCGQLSGCIDDLAYDYDTDLSILPER